MKSFKQYLGPEATKRQDRAEISRQKKHLSQKTSEYHQMSKDEGGGGMAQAHGDMFANAKKSIHSEEVVNEMDGDGSGRDGSNRKKTSTYGNRDRDIPSGPDIHLKHAMKKKDVLSKGVETLNKAFKKVNEDGGAAGVGGGMNVGAIAGSGDSRLPASQREPGVSKKRNPIIGKLARRALPKV